MAKPIRYLFSRKLIPGHGDDDLVQEKEVGRVAAEKRRANQRAGALSLRQRRENRMMRDLGVPVFDRDAGLSELSGYLARGRPR